MVVPMSDHDLYRTWGERIRSRREAKGLKQSALAEAIGTSQQRISQWEQGDRRPPDAVRLKLAEALGTTVADLFPYEVAA